MNNFYESFAATAQRFASRTAVEVQRREPGALDTFTYAELRRMAEAVAGALAARGIAAGDRCAILGENDAQWCAAYLGAMRIGAVPVPLDTAYKPAQIAALLRDSGARILFASPKFLAAAQKASAECGRPPEVVLLRGAADGVASLESTYAAPPAALPESPARRNDPAIILYTSGTTSDPKGVVLTHGNLLAEIEAVLPVVHVDDRDAVLGVLPLFHALAQMANVMLPFAVGARVIFLESLDSHELLRALTERNASAFACVPQFFYLIHQRVQQKVEASGWLGRRTFRALLAANAALRRAGINLGPVLFRRVHAVFGPRMRLLVTGGSRFDPLIGRELFAMGFTILQAYGLTESGGAATVVRPGDPRVDSVGQPLPGIEVKVLPAEGGENELRDGEVAIRGPIVMPGYFNRPDANAAVLRDGWLLTGDLGYFDAAGRLYITGRKKEIIVTSSGKNLYPEEIEAHYQQSPFIKELCIVAAARPGEPAAERLHAVVVPDADALRERKIVNVREIIRFEIETLSAQLPAHKRVLSFEIRADELPRTTTRKLKRFEIERRVRERAQGAEAQAAAPTWTEEERAWAARPEVAGVLAAVAQATQQKEAPRPGASLELDLGLDSMERVELLAHLDTNFGARVPEEAAQRIYTVRDLVDTVLTAGGTRAGGAQAGDAWSKLLGAAPEDDPELRALLRPRPVFGPAVFALMKLLHFLSWLVLGFRAAGREHLPREGPYLLCPNHQSYIDPFLLCAALPYHAVRQLFFVGASEYFATPLMRRLARLVNLIPVDPDANLVRAMQAGAYGLRHGKVLVLFPEGERSIDGTVKRFKKGAAILATHLRAPIVPVAMDGVFELWPRGKGFTWSKLLPWNRPRPRLRFGAPLAAPPTLPAAVTLAEAEARYSAAAENLRAVVLEMWNGLPPRV